MQEEISFGTWLHKQRRALDLTRQAFAAQVGCAEVTLRRIEAGTLKPSKELANIILGKIGIPEAERPQWISFARGVSGLPGQSTPSSKKPITNLPAQLTTFIGREKEQADVIGLLSKHRLVTLTGAGGVGKTRLALKVGEQVLGNYADGVWFLELASLSDPVLVPQTAATMFGITTRSDISFIDLLINFLGARSALLILDNCEHLLDACAHFTDVLLKNCPQLKILATSREPLGITGEAIYRVPSLGLPDLEDLLAHFREFESVKLFEERAQLAQFDFALTLENASSVVQICHRLDGIPLAIELAAAKIGLFSTDQIAKQLEEDFNILTGGSRTDLPHHQTLRASINWSWGLLTESEQRLIRQLSVFAGGWTLEAAQAVCEGDILELTNSLAKKSLIVMKQEAAYETRYGFHEIIRQYAREKLQEAGGEKYTRDRHTEYFMNLAEQAEAELRGPKQVAWLDHLEKEVDNIRTALEWALDVNVEVALRIASALLWFWHIRGHHSEGIYWLEHALSIEKAERDNQPLVSGRAMVRGKGLNASGFLLSFYSDEEKAREQLEASLALYKALGAAGKQGMAYALLGLGYSSPSPGHRERSMMEESLNLFRDAGNKFGVAESLMALGRYAGQVGDYNQAAILGEKQLALRREIGDQDGTAIALARLGDLAFIEGDYERAITLLEESLAIFREVGNKWAMGWWFGALGDVLLWQGNYEQATKIYEEAFAFAQEVGDRSLIVSHYYNMGLIAWFQGGYARATQMIMEGLATFRDIGYHEFLASGMHMLGDIALAKGDEGEAVKWYEAEEDAARETQLNMSLTFMFGSMGKVAWARGDYEQAVKQLDEVLRISLKVDSKPATFYALYGLGRVAQSQGNFASAHEFYAEALGLQRWQVGSYRGGAPFVWDWLKTFRSAVAYPLDGLAVLVSAENQMERAALLFGVTEGHYKPLRFQMSAVERSEHDRAAAAVRAALGEEGFAKWWAQGQAMTLEEAVAYALKED